jgi:hypothetical protein
VSGVFVTFLGQGESGTLYQQSGFKLYFFPSKDFWDTIKDFKVLVKDFWGYSQ